MKRLLATALLGVTFASSVFGAEMSAAQRNFYQRALKADWSGYDWDLSQRDLLNLQSRERKQAKRDKRDETNFTLVAANAYRQRKAPRGQANLAFLLRALPCTDASVTEITADAFADALKNSPEIFLKVLEEAQKAGKGSEAWTCDRGSIFPSRERAPAERVLSALSTRWPEARYVDLQTAAKVASLRAQNTDPSLNAFFEFFRQASAPETRGAAEEHTR